MKRPSQKILITCEQISLSKVKTNTCEKCPYSVLFWSVSSRIRTEYGEIRIISPCSVVMQVRTLFTQCNVKHFFVCSSLVFQSHDFPNLWFFLTILLSFPWKFKKLRSSCLVIPLKVQENEEQLPCTWFHLKITVLFVSDHRFMLQIYISTQKFKKWADLFLLKALSLLESSSLTLKQT